MNGDPGDDRPTQTGAPRPAPIPYGVIAAVFGPATLIYLWVLRTLPNLRFAHPFALALIPIAVALVLWAGLRRGPGRRAVLVHSRATEIAGKRRGWVSRLAELPLVLRLLTVVLLGVVLARPQTSRPDDELE